MCLEQDAQGLVGTPEYLAPEALVAPHLAGPALDVWACGVVLYAMLTSAFPFVQPSNRLDRSSLRRLLRVSRASHGLLTAIS